MDWDLVVIMMWLMLATGVISLAVTTPFIAFYLLVILFVKRHNEKPETINSK